MEPAQSSTRVIKQRTFDDGLGLGVVVFFSISTDMLRATTTTTIRTRHNSVLHVERHSSFERSGSVQTSRAPQVALATTPATHAPARAVALAPRCRQRRASNASATALRQRAVRQRETSAETRDARVLVARKERETKKEEGEKERRKSEQKKKQASPPLDPMRMLDETRRRCAVFQFCTRARARRARQRTHKKKTRATSQNAKRQRRSTESSEVVKVFLQRR